MRSVSAVIHSIKSAPEAGLLEIQQSHALGYQQYYRRAQLSRDWAYPVFHPWYAPLPYRYWR